MYNVATIENLQSQIIKDKLRRISASHVSANEA